MPAAAADTSTATTARGDPDVQAEKGAGAKDRSLRLRRANWPVAFGVDGRNRVYVVELDRGQVSRIDTR